jgi:hypothetical protein
MRGIVSLAAAMALPPAFPYRDLIVLTALSSPTARHRTGKLVGQKAPLKLKEIWAIRVRLQVSKRLRDLAF